MYIYIMTCRLTSHLLLQNYTQDTLKEVLSWYGLQEPSVVTSMAGRGDGDGVTATLVSAASPPVQCMGDAKSADVPLDLTHCQLKTECDPGGLTGEHSTTSLPGRVLCRVSSQVFRALCRPKLLPVTHALVDTWMLTIKLVYKLSDVPDDLKWATNTHVTPFTLTFKA